MYPNIAVILSVECHTYLEGGKGMDNVIIYSLPSGRFLECNIKVE